MYLLDTWYFQHGMDVEVHPLPTDTTARELEYDHLPAHTSTAPGGLYHQVPGEAFGAIERLSSGHWVHTVTANVILG